MNPLIQAQNLSLHYGKDETLVKALDEVSLDIQAQEFTAIVGPSGSGKSSLLHLLGGLDRPNSGQVFLEGKAIDKLSDRDLSRFRRDHIGFIFQAYNLIPVLTVEENIEYVMVLQRLRKHIRHQKVKNILARVGLEGKQNRRPNELSGGQQQRVAVARAVVSSPSIVFADEPTANLDSHSAQNLMEMMKQFNEQDGVTFVFSTHDERIRQLAKRVVTLEDGKIIHDEKR